MHHSRTHADSYSQKHMRSVSASHNCSEGAWAETKTSQKVSRCILQPHTDSAADHTLWSKERTTDLIRFVPTQTALFLKCVLPQMFPRCIKDGCKRLQQLYGFCLHSATFIPFVIYDLWFRVSLVHSTLVFSNNSATNGFPALSLSEDLSLSNFVWTHFQHLFFLSYNLFNKF